MKPQAALRFTPDVIVDTLKAGPAARAINVVRFGLPVDARVVNVFHDRGHDGRRELVLILEAATFPADAFVDDRFMGWPVLRAPELQLAFPEGGGDR